jgi:hypothetical protein
MKIIVNDMMQSNYIYETSELAGENFDLRFRPELSPGQMLQMGIFGGKYMTDCRDEFPADWFDQSKLCHEIHDPGLNFFGVNASKSLAYWQSKGWIYEEDPRGWFQWYCRYYQGRRIPEEDNRQIKRWLAMKRHIVQLQMNCPTGKLSCRPVQRQALLHWAYDSRKF